MRIGFYKDYDALVKDYGEGIGYEFMENTMSSINGARVNPYDFLHGCCDIFANCLHDTYRWPVWVALDEEHRSVHAFCVIEDVFGKKQYIDVRGCTDDWKEFMGEFEDFSTLDVYQATINFREAQILTDVSKTIINEFPYWDIIAKKTKAFEKVS